MNELCEPNLGRVTPQEMCDFGVDFAFHQSLENRRDKVLLDLVKGEVGR